MNKFLITHMATKRSAPLFAAAVQGERNRIAYVAMSALTGMEMRDGGPAPILPSAQAEDVYKWLYGGAP